MASNLQLQIELIFVDDQIPNLNIWMAHQHAICRRSQRCHLDQSEWLDDTWPVILAPLLITYYFLYGRVMMNWILITALRGRILCGAVWTS